ncbi:MAG: hypothetical protein NTZ65_04720 [Candidatus Berkelbacteria bacterium]|nr:hypothetical protein [Candidatus Berkelbacteria bacterium]
MMFSLDVFEPGLSAKDIAIGLFMHNIPALALLAVVVISWKHEIVGGVVFILAGIAYITWVLTSSRFEGNIWAPSLIIGGPAFVIGVLFILNWIKKKQTKNS